MSLADFKGGRVHLINFTESVYSCEMQDNSSFNKIINDFFIEIELTKAEPNEISFILVQNKREQCYELKFRNDNMPPQLTPFFRNVTQLYDYLFEIQENRSFFDINLNGNIKIKKYIKDSHGIASKTIELVTVKANDVNNEDTPLGDRVELEDIELRRKTQSRNNISLMKEKCEIICDKASFMIQNGDSASTIAQTLQIRKATVNKMLEQFRIYGRIFPPKKYKNAPSQAPTQLEDNYYNKAVNNEEEAPTYTDDAFDKEMQPIGPVPSNMKMHGEGVRGIKKLLYVIVKEGKMQSLDEMRNYLLQRKIDRSLSSIYRYVTSIKIENPEFQGRNYTMYRKDVENLEKGNENNTSKKTVEEAKK